jgi:glycosyltransferase involved in cell wall biosynthesis
VSVALLTYNHERYITQALQSVLSQQLASAFEIISGFQRMHIDRLRTIFPDRNLGSHGNKMWRQVLEGCRGEYIALLDGDDYWTSPEKLQTQVAFLDTHPECVAC